MQTSVKLAPLLCALQLGACAGIDAQNALVIVPEQLKAGTHEKLDLVVPASGVQIYECRASQQKAGAYEWVFVAPEADLFDTRGKQIGRHYGGPHWEAFDGSRIVGTLKQRADAPAGGAIPWLLLAAKSVGPEGSFKNVTSIQRVNTVGGTPPQAGCSAATAGAPARVSYTADYYFFSAKQGDGR